MLEDGRPARLAQTFVRDGRDALSSIQARKKAARKAAFETETRNCSAQSPSTGSASDFVGAGAMPLPFAGFDSAPSGIKPFSATTGFSFSTTSR